MSRKNGIFLALMVAVVAAGPLFLVDFPPVTDLPQHLCQIRLFYETLSDGSDIYQIQWWSPNTLIYLLLAIPWLVLRPAVMAKVALLVIIFSWLAAIALMVKKRNRPAEAGLIALPFVFNHALYWGFLNFLIGFPVFVCWLLLSTSKRESRPGKQILGYVILSLLLYASHALWFAVGLAWLLFYSVFKGLPLKKLAVRLLGVIPVVLLSWLWYPSLSSTRAEAGFDVAAHWLTPVWERLNPVWMMNSALGGLVGLLEPLTFLMIVAWVAVGIMSNRGRLKTLIDRDLVLAAAFFFVLALLAPDKYMNTIYFSSRWIPGAMILLILALPVPRMKLSGLRVFSLLVFVVFCGLTAFRWMDFEKKELSGLRESLDQIPFSSRVMGLDFVKQSELIKGSPFLQMAAYAQVLKGGELSFSFAEHSSGIVAYRKKRRVSWTPGLEWFPERVQKSDFGQFDFVIVNGREDIQRRFSSIEEIVPLTPSGRWRLYRVNKK